MIRAETPKGCISPDQIPPEVVEALAVAWRDEMNSAHALAAALNAWPGAVWRESGMNRKIMSRRIILPPPLEVSDD